MCTGYHGLTDLSGLLKEKRQLLVQKRMTWVLVHVSERGDKGWNGVTNRSAAGQLKKLRKFLIIDRFAGLFIKRIDLLLKRSSAD